MWRDTTGQSANNGLKEHRWLLTVLACFLLIGIVPSSREVMSYQLRRDRLGAWRNTLGMLRSVEYGPLGIDMRACAPDLLHLAERTNQPRDWMVVAGQAPFLASDLPDVSTLLQGDAATGVRALFERGQIIRRRALTYMERALTLAPNDPMLNARTAMYYAELISQERVEDYGNMPLPKQMPPRQFTDAEWTAAIACVQRGKAADPNNAFFDYLHASFLFAVNRDAEAFAALHAAAKKPHFDDYGVESQQAVAEAMQAIGVPLLENLHATAPAFNSYYFARLRQMARILSYHARRHRESGNTAAADALCKDGLAMGAHLRDEGDTNLHALVGIAIQSMMTKVASPTISGYAGTETQKNVRLRGNMNKRISNLAKEMMSSGLIHAEAFKLTVIWLLVWAALMTLFALVVDLLARDAPTEATNWQARDVVLLVFFLIGVVASACVYGWAWNAFAEKRLGERAATLLPWFAGLLLALPPLSVMMFTFIYAWRLRLSLPRRATSFWRILCGCLRTAARTSAVTFALTAVALLPFLTHYRTKATNYLRTLPTKERRQMDKWLAGQ